MAKPLFKNILVVINNTDSSINALKYAVIMARQYHCKVYAIYVVDTATIRQLTMRRFFIEEESREYEQSLDENGRRYLQYADEIAREKGVKIEPMLRRGMIWSEVVAAAEELEVDMILLGGFEKGPGDPKDLLSSSAKAILLNARCSVLVVKEKMIEKLYKIC